MLSVVQLAETERLERPSSVSDRLIVALDVGDVEAARDIVRELRGVTSFFKIGLRLQFNGGLELARNLAAEGNKIFLDSKLFDIEETIVGVIDQVLSMGVTYLTVHGDASVVKAAVKGRNGNNNLKLLSVTCLTSLDASDLLDQGISLSVEEYVRNRVRSAINAGCDGVISSGHEAAMIRKMAPSGFKIVTPAIRSLGDSAGDQKRIATPKSAILAGADHLVVGRPILNADNRRAKAQAMLAEVEEALAELSAD